MTDYAICACGRRMRAVSERCSLCARRAQSTMDSVIKPTSLARRLREEVKRLGSQRSLAELAGVRETSLYNWLHGHWPDEKNFARLAAVVPGLPTDCVFTAEMRSALGRTNYADAVKSHRAAFPEDPSSGKAHDVFHHRAVYDASAGARTGKSRTEQARKSISKGQKAVWEGNAARRDKLRATAHTLDNWVVGWGMKRLHWREQVSEAGHSGLLDLLGKRDMTVAELAAEIKVGPDYLSAALREGRRLRVVEGNNPPVRRRLGRKLRQRIALVLETPEDELARLEPRPLALAEVKVWARECAAAHKDGTGKPPSPKRVLQIWQDRDLFPDVNYGGRPPSLSQSERAAVLKKVEPLFEEARRTKPEGRLPNEHWRNVSEALYGSNALVARARSWCRHQPKLERYL
jgi:hypothetical protein